MSDDSLKNTDRAAKPEFRHAAVDLGAAFRAMGLRHIDALCRKRDVWFYQPNSDYRVSSEDGAIFRAEYCGFCQYEFLGAFKALVWAQNAVRLDYGRRRQPRGALPGAPLADNIITLCGSAGGKQNV